MITKKNLIKVFFVMIAIMALFTSCLDYVQIISYENSEYKITYRIAASKLFFEKMELEENNYEGFFDGLVEHADLEENFKNAKVTSIDTELEYGRQYILKIPSSSVNKNEQKLLPKVKDDKIYIPFLTSYFFEDFPEPDDTEEDEAIVTAMSSVKFRVFVEKKIVKNIKKAYFAGSEKDFVIPVADYGSMYCFEIPCLVVYFEGLDFSNIIVE